MLLFYDKYLWYLGLLELASVQTFYDSSWLTVLLIIYFIDSEAGSTILIGLGRVWSNIVNTFILGILTIFMFGMAIYQVFRNDPADNAPTCATLYQCIGQAIVAGIGQGDISVLFHDNIWNDVPEIVYYEPLTQLRTFLIIVFFMLWEYVLLNIFVGLIASAFEAMRDDKSTVQEDSATKCLICSLDMYTFEKCTKHGFKHHVEFQHNPLRYVFYLHYLKKTKETDYTGADTVVLNKLTHGSNAEDCASWLPINRALSLRKHEEEAHEEHVMQQQEVSNQVAMLLERHKKEIDEQAASLRLEILEMFRQIMESIKQESK